MNIIEEISCQVIKTHLKKPFVTALHEVDDVLAIKVDISLNNGMHGIGTATPNEKVTGDTLTSALDVMEKVIKPALLNEPIDNWNELINKLQKTVVHNTPAKAAYEIALYDLRSQLFGVSLTYLLGSNIDRPVTTDYTISIGPEKVMLDDSLKKVNEGFKSIKVKLGNRDIEDDIQIVEALSAELPSDVSLRLDINQGWTVKQTLRAVAEWNRIHANIDFIEQPVKLDDIYGMQRITKLSPYEIMADESVFSEKDAFNIIDEHACDLINIKLMKTGGLSVAEKINSIATDFGIHCMVGCMIESRESIAAAVAFASAHKNIIYADLDSVYMSEDTGNKGFSIEKNQLIPSKENGLGF